MAEKNYRLRELDFLRGTAILLVLARHQYLFDLTTRMGWIGVDLFFVLSGFLVSGLLFKEYSKFGDIRPGLFLIRRGFKIYPIYYLFYGLHLLPKLLKYQFDLHKMLAELLFIQNYVLDWGYAFIPGWSLAVEEHFYIGFALLLFLALKYHWIKLGKQFAINFSRFEWIILAIMVLCLLMRFEANIDHPERRALNNTMTHLRIDSLFMGVLISYWYHFKKEWFTPFISKYKKMLLLAAVAFLSFTPFVDRDASFFAMTLGYTLVYIAFGIVLCWFLVDQRINVLLDKSLSKPMVDLISKIGFASYSIYYIHGFVNTSYNMAEVYVLHYHFPLLFTFLATNTVSVIFGMLMTRYIEQYFLAIRNKRYPARSNSL